MVSRGSRTVAQCEILDCRLFHSKVKEEFRGRGNVWCCRAQKRLQNGREEAKRPGAEKAARTQELHKALRVRWLAN